jgi:hypothetical protein
MILQTLRTERRVLHERYAHEYKRHYIYEDISCNFSHKSWGVKAAF